MNPPESTQKPAKDIEEMILERLAAMPLNELAQLGRPSVPAGKPQAEFVSVKKGMFTYNVRGKHFHPKDRGEVERLVKGKPGGDKKSEMKRLDRLLLRPLTISLKVVGQNATRRIREQLELSAEAARVAKLCQDLGAPYREEDAGTYVLTKPTGEKKPVKAEVIWDSRGFCAIKIDETRILPCHLITAGSVWERVIEKPFEELLEDGMRESGIVELEKEMIGVGPETACCSKSDPCEAHREALTEEAAP